MWMIIHAIVVKKFFNVGRYSNSFSIFQDFHRTYRYFLIKKCWLRISHRYLGYIIIIISYLIYHKAILILYLLEYIIVLILFGSERKLHCSIWNKNHKNTFYIVGVGHNFFTRKIFTKHKSSADIHLFSRLYTDKLILVNHYSMVYLFNSINLKF